MASHLYRKPPALLLDTHIALWLDSGHAALRQDTADLIDECWHRGGTIYLSAVSAWETALLVDTGRIDLELPVLDWIERFLERPGLEPLPLSPAAAAQAYRLHPYAPRDPGDRLLMASAIAAGCPLVTYDQHIREFAERHGSQYRLAVAG